MVPSLCTLDLVSFWPKVSSHFTLPNPQSLNLKVDLKIQPGCDHLFWPIPTPTLPCQKAYAEQCELVSSTCIWCHPPPTAFQMTQPLKTRWDTIIDGRNPHLLRCKSPVNSWINCLLKVGRISDPTKVNRIWSIAKVSTVLKRADTLTRNIQCTPRFATEIVQQRVLHLGMEDEMCVRV